MSLNPLFSVGALVSAVVFVVFVKVWLGMRRKESKQQSLGGFEKPEARVVSKHEEIAMPEAADFSPEVSQVARDLQFDHDAVLTFSSAVNALAEPEVKSTFLAIMTRLVQEKKE